MQFNNKSELIIAILIPLAVGSISSLISANMLNYPMIPETPLSPPAIVFPIVWTILYILMGISSYIIYNSKSPDKNEALKLYALQLFFNFAWSILFFNFSQYFLSFLWLIALIILIILMIVAFYKIKPLAAYLQIPYLLWCIFAAILNFLIYLAAN